MLFFDISRGVTKGCLQNRLHDEKVLQRQWLSGKPGDNVGSERFDGAVPTQTRALNETTATESHEELNSLSILLAHKLNKHKDWPSDGEQEPNMAGRNNWASDRGQQRP
ncbi:hypothetical protein JTB14_015211 [Gonioctena quinquepunctata]|nr:hypothetical protein JTB14_015211 [Gonioctena quinquepunctata]